MTAPLVVLAAGALLAGFVGIPAALGGSNAIERFLEPSFVAAPLSPTADASAHEEEGAGAHASRGLELQPVLDSFAALGREWQREDKTLPQADEAPQREPVRLTQSLSVCSTPE